MSRIGPSRAALTPQQLPIWLAALLVQLGSFSLILGFGVIAVSLAYGSRSVLVGLAFVALGYLAVGFPGWYFARAPFRLDRIRRLRACFRGLDP